MRAASPGTLDNKERRLGMASPSGLSVTSALAAIDMKDLAGHERRDSRNRTAPTM